MQETSTALKLASARQTLGRSCLFGLQAIVKLFGVTSAQENVLDHLFETTRFMIA